MVTVPVISSTTLSTENDNRRTTVDFRFCEGAMYLSDFSVLIWILLSWQVGGGVSDVHTDSTVEKRDYSYENTIHFVFNDTVTVSMTSKVFCVVMPCTSERTRRFGGIHHPICSFPPASVGLLLDLLLNSEDICLPYSSETLVGFRQTTRRYVPQDKALRNHRCHNLNPYR
jgi:hypothetical protein